MFTHSQFVRAIPKTQKRIDQGERMDNMNLIQSDFSKFLATKGLNEAQINGVIERLKNGKGNPTDKTHLKLFKARNYFK